MLISALILRHLNLHIRRKDAAWGFSKKETVKHCEIGVFFRPTMDEYKRVIESAVLSLSVVT